MAKTPTDNTRKTEPPSRRSLLARGVLGLGASVLLQPNGGVLGVDAASAETKPPPPQPLPPPSGRTAKGGKKKGAVENLKK